MFTTRVFECHTKNESNNYKKKRLQNRLFSSLTYNSMEYSIPFSKVIFVLCLLHFKKINTLVWRTLLRK